MRRKNKSVSRCEDFFSNFRKEKIIASYKDSFAFIKSSEKYIYSIIVIFLIFSFLGYFVPLSEDVSSKIIDYFKQLVEETRGFSFFQMFGYLFENNLYASFFGMIFGIALGVFSIFNAVVNGFVLGFASKVAVAESGFLYLLRLFPHGIFELPALFLSLGIGLRMGFVLFTKDDFKETLLKSLKTFVLVIIPLLFVAGIIESALIVFFS